MNRSEPCELTNLVLLRDGEKMLLQQSSKEGWKGLCWPGGHVEPGEAFFRSAVREVFEETGLVIDRMHLCGLKQFEQKGARYIVFLYKADAFHGELHDCAEGKNGWYLRSELSDEDLVPGFDSMLRIFEEEDLQEFQYLGDGQDLTEVLIDASGTESRRKA